jgi:hypothetical protein
MIRLPSILVQLLIWQATERYREFESGSLRQGGWQLADSLASPPDGARSVARIDVVFPAPLGPSRPKTSPSRTSKLTPATASISP